MNHTCSQTDFPIRRSNSRPGLWWLTLLITGLVWACNLRQPTDLEQTQAANMRLTKTFHVHLNHHNWSALEKLCAETVRYRSRATLTNHGTVRHAGNLIIGNSGVSLGGYGISNTSTFTNEVGSNTTINYSSDRQLYNYQNASFTNQGQILIGDLSGVNYGIYNEGLFNHQVGGITIRSANNSGIINDFSTFTCSASISISTVTSGGPGRGRVRIKLTIH